MKLTKLKHTLGLFFMFTMFSVAVHATGNQITFPDDVDDEGPQAPIDGFVALGVAAGAYLGLKKHKLSKK